MFVSVFFVCAKVQLSCLSLCICHLQGAVMNMTGVIPVRSVPLPAG